MKSWLLSAASCSCASGLARDRRCRRPGIDDRLAEITGSGGPSFGTGAAGPNSLAAGWQGLRAGERCPGCRVPSRSSRDAVRVRRRGRRLHRAAATIPSPSSTLRDSRVTGARLGRRRISASICPPPPPGSVTIAASRRCARRARPAGARRRAATPPPQTGDRRSCGCPGRGS